ncbi:hypothetical protein BKA82DRAFT_4018215 [Pisolithus tinctorius]|nr:hypothetical protein BKA82DRAFT_4018215 [Pisolithus tinctorius]
MPTVECCPGGKGLPHKPHDGGFSSCNSPSSSAEVKVETTGVLAEMYGILESSTHTVFNLQHESKSQLNYEVLLLLNVAHTQCKVFHAEQALAAWIAHEYESMAKLYKYKVGSGEARVHEKDMEILIGTVIEHTSTIHYFPVLIEKCCMLCLNEARSTKFSTTVGI